MRCASSTILMLLFPLVQTFTLLSPSLSSTSPIATSTSLSSLPLQVAASAVTYTTLVFAYDRPRGSLFVDIGEDVIIRDSNIPGAGKVRGWEGEEGGSGGGGQRRTSTAKESKRQEYSDSQASKRQEYSDSQANALTHLPTTTPTPPPPPPPPPHRACSLPSVSPKIQSLVSILVS
jgi:hypothetical protein